MAPIGNRQASVDVAIAPASRHAARAVAGRERHAALLTHFGSVGLLLMRGIVTEVGQPGDAETRVIHYRRQVDGKYCVELPAGIDVDIGDMIMIRALTLPDGAVRPIMARAKSQREWIMLDDVNVIVDDYTRATRRFVRWGTGAGSALAMLAVCGIAAPLALTTAVFSFAGAWSLHRRDRQDRTRIGRWLAR
ncbi:hypothetical protein P7B04_21615 [Sphingobium yanoikuyae]|uniref:hypothetical protein n=1 Tax=Sphingobium yanoikuyae TaxID=13690 RepID=UPI000846F460|nr:hypothetical protein [Sphingobium yanoikuyae]MDG2515281.1 hypothetical protein [Sphingobium yanoikuyae]